MKGLQFVLAEAQEEFLHGIRSGVVQLLFVGLTAYLLLILSSATYIREMGAVGIPRNAPMLIYLMMSGQAFYLIFAYAWLFAQTIVRERQAGLHELVPATPRPLYQLLLGRYLGAFGVACILGLSQAAGLLLSPVLVWVGWVPAGEIMPMQWLALAWSWVLFVIPIAAGMGAYYFSIAVWTKKSSGCFAFAALLILCWMFSMIVLKGGHISPTIATIIDPSGYAEAETQVLSWTPHTKTYGFIALTWPLLINRIVWGILPLLLFAFVLWTVRREDLVLIQEKASKTPSSKRTTAFSASDRPRPGLITEASWTQVAFGEWRWLCQQLLTTRAFWVSLLLMLIMSVAGSFVHIVAHADGPLVPRPGLLGPMMQEFTYLIIAFVIAGLIGTLARKDDHLGFSEIFDTAPAPDWVRGVARFGAILVLLFFFSLVPGTAGAIVTMISAPHTLSLTTYMMMSLAQMFPAFLELGALIFLTHSLFRSSGPAYAMSMFAAFILVLNHELSLVTFPLFEIGLPVHASYSPLTGWGPWRDSLLVGGACKVGLSLCLFAIAGLIWPRGSTSSRPIGRRTRGVYGYVLFGSLVMMAVFGWIGYDKYVTKGDYQSSTAKIAADAHWEQKWLAKRSPFSVKGGEVVLTIHPSQRKIEGTWRLRGFRSHKGTLSASLPEQLTSMQARCAGRRLPLQMAYDHLLLDLKGCDTARQVIELKWSITQKGWFVEGRPSYINPTSYWIRARDVMPRLGTSAMRVLRAPPDRHKYGLPKEFHLPKASATPSVMGVAPEGTWRWQVKRIQGTSTKLEEGHTKDPLDFGASWSAKGLQRSHKGYTVSLTPSYSPAMAALVTDVEEMRRCVSRKLGTSITLDTIYQLPRHLGQLTQIGKAIWLPEDKGWDITPLARSPGRFIRRAALAQAIAKHTILRATHLRENSGYLWMTAGAAGAIGILCVGEMNGSEAVQILLKKGAERTIQALSASQVPVTTLAHARPSDWAHVYAPLAALYWSSQQTPQAWQALFKTLRQGTTVAKALEKHTNGLSVSLMMGPPNASDLSITTKDTKANWKTKRWQWKQGGWQLLTSNKNKEPTSWTPPTGQKAKLRLDRWCSFEREPKDNLHESTNQTN